MKLKINGSMVIALLAGIVLTYMWIELLNKGFDQVYFEPTSEALRAAKQAVQPGVTWAAASIVVAGILTALRRDWLSLYNAMPGVTAIASAAATSDHSLNVIIILILVTLAAPVNVWRSYRIRVRNNSLG